MSADKRERIRMLNDQLRRNHLGGRILVTEGVLAHGPQHTAATLLAVKLANNFNDANDPYGEHDFGSVVVAGARTFWKIDYYDLSLSSHAVDPADPDLCVRVLTIMLAEEY